MATSIIADPSELNDKLTRRVQQSRAVLNSLLAAMQSDSPPVGAVIEDTIWAATELLEIEGV